jgi:HD-GYP domain-containing protein (c-di-GMP phosphodiesterase class II)
VRALAGRLARSLELPDDDVRAACYTALLHHVGCPGYAHETARLFGDELVLNVDAVRRRGGGMLDPAMAGRFVDHAEALLGEVNAGDPRALALEAEPRPGASVPEDRLAEVAAVFADLADLKTPFTQGHSRGVAALARGAAERLRLPPATVADLEVAGLLHDLGRVAVPDTVWEKPGALSGHDWEQVRLHAYHSERILAGSERLAPLASLVGMRHERLDGGGYHRGCARAELPMAVRGLAAADAWQAMAQPRPHRPALAPEQAERRLLGAARQGGLGADAVAPSWPRPATPLWSPARRCRRG